MFRIDAHQHFWLYDAASHSWITDEMSVIKRDFTPEDLLVHLKTHRIDGVITVQVDQTEMETHALIALGDKYDFIKGVVGWVDFTQSNVAERLTYFSQFPKLKGFRHIVQAEQDPGFLTQKKFLAGIEALKNHEFSYDILITHGQLPVTNMFLNHFPDIRFVIDHIAKPAIARKDLNEWTVNIRKAATHQNVFCKISGLVTEADWNNFKDDDFHPYLDVVVDSFGFDRILYGSDWPVCLVASSYKRQIKILEDYFAKFDNRDQDKFWGLNAIRFYNL